MLKVRETRTHHQGEYSTWSDRIMAKEQVWTPICSFTMSVIIWNTMMHFKWTKCVQHGWQLSYDVIYLVYISNLQMFVGWLHGHRWGKPFTLSIQWCIVIVTFYAYLLVEVTRNISLVSTPYMWWISYMCFEVKHEDRWLNFQGMGRSKLNFCCWILFNSNTLSKVHILAMQIKCYDATYLYCTTHIVRHNCKQLYYANYYYVNK